MGNLAQQRDFLKLWAGQTVSLFGSRVTFLALPLTAILILHATPLQIGILGAAGSAPPLLFALPAGAWVDRVRRRPILIVANAGQAALLFTIPIAAWLGVLSLPQLYAVSFLKGTCAMFFDVAYRSYLPALVPRDLLVRANSRLTASESLAQIAGPGIGGALVQLLTAPLAIAADGLSFVVAALSLTGVRGREPAVVRAGQTHLRREVIEGLATVRANPLLSSLTGASATFNLFDSVLFAVYVLYMSRTLHLTPAAIGLIFGLAGGGGLLGALLVSPLTTRLGLGRALGLGVLLATAGELLIAGARGPQVVAMLVLIAAEGAVELGASLYGINSVSLRQTVTPDRLRGRVTAINNLLSFGLGSIGALVGGALGQTIGLRQTVLLAGLGTLLSLLWIARSPVRRLQALPPSATA